MSDFQPAASDAATSKSTKTTILAASTATTTPTTTSHETNAKSEEKEIKETKTKTTTTNGNNNKLQPTERGGNSHSGRGARAPDVAAVAEEATQSHRHRHHQQQQQQQQQQQRQQRKRHRQQHPTIITNSYDIQEKIGNGAFGTVFSANPKDNAEKKVAIKRNKFPPKNKCDHDRRLRDVRNEIEALKDLRSCKYVVNYVDYIAISDDEHFLVMEYVGNGKEECKNLVELIRSRRAKRLSEELVRILANNLIQAVAAMKELRIVHRDIKPENIVPSKLPYTREELELDPTWNWKHGDGQPYSRYESLRRSQQMKFTLVDFGCCKREHEIDERNVGTVAFASPELLRNSIDRKRYGHDRYDGCIDYKSDLFSFFCTLHYALHGKLPWGDENTGDAFKALQNIKKKNLNCNFEVSESPEFQELRKALCQEDPNNRSDEEALQAVESWNQRSATQYAATRIQYEWRCSHAIRVEMELRERHAISMQRAARGFLARRSAVLRRIFVRISKLPVHRLKETLAFYTDSSDDDDIIVNVPPPAVAAAATADSRANLVDAPAGADDAFENDTETAAGTEKPPEGDNVGPRDPLQNRLRKLGATSIQRTVRGFLARKFLLVMKNAATKIQSVCRSFLAYNPSVVLRRIFVFAVDNEPEALRLEKERLQSSLQSYGRNFFPMHKRQVSSFVDIKPLRIDYEKYVALKSQITQTKQAAPAQSTRVNNSGGAPAPAPFAAAAGPAPAPAPFAAASASQLQFSIGTWGKTPKIDNTVSKISALEAEVEEAKKEASEAKKRQDSIEIDLADQLAEAKAAAAASDLNAAKKMKQFRIDLEESKAIEIELRKQLEEAKTTSQSIQSTFASLVGEKEKLLKENKDLEAVCEELMGELEATTGQK